MPRSVPLTSQTTRSCGPSPGRGRLPPRSSGLMNALILVHAALVCWMLDRVE
jgi:hypothetical protein